MHLSSDAVNETTRQMPPRSRLNKRLPRIGRVVFSEHSSAVHCAVKSYSETGAVLTMSGWMGLPSEFQLYVEPDNTRATCSVVKRKGSNIEVQFSNLEYGIRFRASA